MFVASVDRKWSNTSFSGCAIQQGDYVFRLSLCRFYLNSTVIKTTDGDNVKVNMYVWPYWSNTSKEDSESGKDKFILNLHNGYYLNLNSSFVYGVHDKIGDVEDTHGLNFVIVHKILPNLCQLTEYDQIHINCEVLHICHLDHVTVCVGTMLWQYVHWSKYIVC